MYPRGQPVSITLKSSGGGYPSHIPGSRRPGRRATRPQTREVADVAGTRHLLAVALFCDRSPAGRHPPIQSRVVPQLADSVEPGLDLRFARSCVVLTVIQAGIGITRPAPPSAQSPPITPGSEPRSLTIGGMPLIIASAATRPNGSSHTDGTSRIRVRAR